MTPIRPAARAVGRRSGRGLTQSYNEAAKWIRKAAEHGIALAQVKLGLLYEQSFVLDSLVDNHFYAFTGRLAPFFDCLFFDYLVANLPN